MTIPRLIPAVLSFLLLGAHFFRAGQVGLVGVCLACVLLLFRRKRWVHVTSQLLLAGGAIIWIAAMSDLIAARRSMGMPWQRMALILSGVAAFTAISAWMLRAPALAARYFHSSETARASASAFFATAAVLGIVQIKVPFPALLPERFLPGSGWLLVFALAAYAAWLTEKMLNPTKQAQWRMRAWSLFSAVFFAQLALGLVGFDDFLMTGKLHFPIPALIVAGPIFRGEGIFMPILFGATLILIGPAWCSHLCYIGAWDNACAASRKRPSGLPSWTGPVRLAIALAVIACAFSLRLAGVPVVIAGIFALAFGIAGVAVMLVFSLRTGTMAHCTVFCPIGLIADIAGKLSPFRIRIGDACTKCGSCSKACRYNALGESDIERKRPALTCTLCGDCVGKCKDGQINYRLLNLPPDTARAVFIVLAVSLHASFLGVARI